MKACEMSKIKTWQWAILGAIIALVILRLTSMKPSGPVKIGETAPRFTVPALQHGAIKLQAYRGKVVVLNFWATWCPPCVEETPSLEAFAQRVKDDGVIVLGVSVDEHEPALKKFAADYHLTYPIGRDPGGALAAHYGTYKFPETYIIDRTGRVAEKIIGAMDWTDPRMLAFVESLADGGKAAPQPQMAGGNGRTADAGHFPNFSIRFRQRPTTSAMISSSGMFSFIWRFVSRA